MNPVSSYAESVLSGETIAGRLVKLACERHLLDLETGEKRGLRFDWEDGERVIRFCEILHHYKGPFARLKCTCETKPEECQRRLRLLPWQKFCIGSVFGWKRYNEEVSSWTRRFVEALILVGRKNGKSHLANGVGFYMLRFDGEPAAEVYAAAVTKEQSRYVHDIGKNLIKATPGLRSRLAGWDEKWGNIHSEDGSYYEPVSREAQNLDARSPYCVILDEVHAHRSPDVRETLKTGMGAREAPVEGVALGTPLLLEISTAGVDTDDSICRSLCDDAEIVLEHAVKGDHMDDSLFAYIAQPDAGLDWRSSKEYLYMANPSLGSALSEREILRERDKAKRNPLLENDFRTKRGNEWTAQTHRLISMDSWDECPSEVVLEALRGRECFGGVDLAASQDLNAFSLLFPPLVGEFVWTVLCWQWIPEKRLQSRALGDRGILKWVKDGWIETMPGVRRDNATILARIREKGDIYRIREIGVDPWQATDLTAKLSKDFVTVQVAQTFRHLSNPTKELVALVDAKHLNHGGNPVLRWNARNTEGQWDGKENVQPKKVSQKKRIDGVTATLNALNRALAVPGRRESKYNEGEVLTLG